MFFGQIEADYVATVLLEESREVLLCANSAFILHFVDDDIGLGCERAWRLRPKEGDRCANLHIRAKNRMRVIQCCI